MDDLEQHKQVIKEAIKEWLDDRFADFGKWTIKSLGAVILTAVVIYLVNHGFIK